MKIFSIGKILKEKESIKVVLKEKYRLGLKGLADFSHVQILYWMDGCDNEPCRNKLVEEKPYKNGPNQMGVFALRSPERPNPIAVSNATISYVDVEKGEIGIYYIDAFDNSDVIDIKPYTPSIDRVEHSISPSWCSHWPNSYEESSNFDWNEEFNF